MCALVDGDAGHQLEHLVLAHAIVRLGHGCFNVVRAVAHQLADGSIAPLRRIANLIAELGPGRQAARPRPQDTSAADLLTKSECEIASLIAAGLTSSQMAERLQLAKPTVITHRRNLMAKLKLRGAAQITTKIPS